MLRTALAAAAICAAIACAPSDDGEPAPLTATIDVSGLYAEGTEELAASLREILDEDGLAGLTAAAAVDGEVVFSSGFGYADLENHVPVTSETRMRIGSVSKAITSIALAVLYERGELDLDAPVQTYLPEFPQKRHSISPRQVAGHIAGIRHYRGAEFLSAKNYDDVVEALEIFENDPLLFEPGSDYSYSTYGWNLISAVVQRAADEPFLEFMQREVFDPFGMESTIADHNRNIISDRTRFYVRLEGGGLGNADFVDNSIKWAGGGFLSTAEDLLRFGQGVMDDTVLEVETRKLLWTSLETSDGEETGYGLGWNLLVFDPIRASNLLRSMATKKEVEAMRGRFFARHGGSSMGGVTAFLLLPEAKVAVAIVSNTSGVPNLGGRLMNVAMLTAHRLATKSSADWMGCDLKPVQ